MTPSLAVCVEKSNRALDFAWYNEPQAARPQNFSVRCTVCNQCNRCPAVEWRTSPVDVVEVRTTSDEANRCGHTPHTLVEHGSLGARGYQCDAVAVLRHLAQPLHSLAPEWWVAPDSADPIARQPIDAVIVVPCSRVPWSSDWSARVEVELPEWSQYLGRCQPLVVTTIALM